VTVKLVFRKVAGNAECHCRYESLQPGNTWKRALFAASALSPGEYRVGVARMQRAAGPGQECSCSDKADEARMLARRIMVVP
jgi:hypothetical protein